MERILREFLFRLAVEARDLNTRIGLVGGTVRDILLGKSSFDLDVVVESDAIEFVSKVLPHNKKRLYKYFHTATVWIEEVGRVDFASAREESYPYCAARPQIKLSTIEKDLFRRDFTINAMVILLETDKENPLGQLIDLYHGRHDLSKGILNVLHDKSFCDDPIRILRGIRYAVRFGFDFSKRTHRLIEEARDKGYLLLLPKDRLRDEYTLIKKEPEPEKVFSMIREKLNLDLEALL